MTREDLIGAIENNKEIWSCPSEPKKCEDSHRDCKKCAEQMLAEYEQNIRSKTIDEFAEWLCNKYEVFEPEDDGYTLYGDMKYHSKEELLEEFCIGDKCDDCANHPMYIQGKIDGRKEAIDEMITKIKNRKSWFETYRPDELISIAEAKSYIFILDQLRE